MFSIFKSSSLKFPIGQLLKVDMHSHILPGIDDGAKDIDTSLRLIRGLKSLGYERLIATPHVYAELHPNTPETIELAANQLQTALLEHEIPIDLHYAAEYMIDESFDLMLEAKTLLQLSKPFVLVETMFLSELPNFVDTLFRLQAAGYSPIIAHPERYHFMFGNLAKAEDLKSRGALLQVNALSLIGYYGKHEKHTAVQLLEAGLIDFIGTDLHHERHLDRLVNYQIDRKIQRLFEKANFRNSELSPLPLCTK